MSHWSKHLPSELLDRIASLIDNETDLIRFGSVCSSWHNSAAGQRERFYAAALQYLSLELIKHTISLVGDQDLGSWLVKVAEREDIRNYKRLLNPLQSYPFRPDSLTENIPRVLPMQRFRVKELHHLYVLRNTYKKRYSWSRETFVRFRKAVVVWSPDGSGEFVVLTIVRGRMARFDTDSNDWTWISDNRNRFKDVIFHKGELLGVDSTGELLGVDSTGRLVIAATGSSHGFRGEKFLVHSINGELLLVDKCTQNDWGVVNFNFNFGPPRLNAYKLNEEEKTWVEIQSLGDTVLFLGDESAFSVSSSDLHGCTTRNCIFFTDTPSRICPSEEMDALYGMNVFDLQSGEVTPLKNCDNYSKLLWPPPAWLSPSSSSFDDVSPPKLSSIRTLLLFFNVISMFETDRLKMKAFGGWVVPEESESIPGGTLVTFRLVEFARLALVLLT
ncbi:F-box protein SKIP23 [Linum perenne]